MIDSSNIPEIKSDLEQIENKLSFFIERIKDSPEIETQGYSPEEERTRIRALVDSHIQKFPNVLEIVEKSLSRNGADKINLADLLVSLETIDEIFAKLKTDLEEIAKTQYQCKLGAIKQEIFKTINRVLDNFDFIIPNIRHEIAFVEKFYRIPANARNSVFPELTELVENLEEHKITLSEFMWGTELSDRKGQSYKELRSRNGIFPKFQSYENPPEAYTEINDCFYLICKTMEPFLQEKKSVPEIGKFLNQIKEKNKKICRMNDIFEKRTFISSMISTCGKKYSYCEEVNKTKALVQKFSELQKSLIIYNEEELEKIENTLASLMKEEEDKARLSIIMEETNKYIIERTLPFDRIEIIFSKLMKKDFNIVVQEKAAADITIAITPSHEKKYGKDLLERINIIIMEIDFWYPSEKKQLLFQSLSTTTKKIQAEEPVDKNDVARLMQNYDQVIEQHLRSAYPEKIKTLTSIFSSLQKTFKETPNRDKLEKRLVNKEIWEEINPKLENIKKGLLVLASGNSSLKKHVNKFPFLKLSTNELCQLLYDLSMQLFVMYPGMEGKSVLNMTNILSVYNEFHDPSSLWAAFSHYFKKTTIPNLIINEKLMIHFTQNHHCKAELRKLFPV